MFLVDSHCHLDLLDLTANEDNVEKVIQRAKENGVHGLLNVSVSLKDFPIVLQAAEQYPFVWASIGEHPNESPGEPIEEEALVKLAKNDKVIAIGETGLDYYRSKGDLSWQQDRFKQHIKAAKLVKKPIIVHTREAKNDTIRIMQSEGAEQVGGVMHCFTEDWEMARQALDLGFYISFSGIVTFKNAVAIQEVAKQVPIERMLIETDAPYLAPNPHRGKANEPAYVRYTAEYLANLHNVSLEKFAEITTSNFFTLFKGAERPHV